MIYDIDSREVLVILEDFAGTSTRTTSSTFRSPSSDGPRPRLSRAGFRKSRARKSRARKSPGRKSPGPQIPREQRVAPASRGQKNAKKRNYAGTLNDFLSFRP